MHFAFFHSFYRIPFRSLFMSPSLAVFYEILSEVKFAAVAGVVRERARASASPLGAPASAPSGGQTRGGEERRERRR